MKKYFPRSVKGDSSEISFNTPFAFKMFWFCPVITTGCGNMDKCVTEEQPGTNTQFFSVGTKRLFTFYVIPPYWHDTGNWNPSSSKTSTYLSYIANIMGVDVLAT